MANLGAGSALEDGSVTLFEPNTASGIRSVDRQHVTKFVKEWERYEL